MAKKKVEIDKPKLKAKIKELKVERDKALETHDHKELKMVRRRIHRLKHELRAHG
jgi:DNA replication initiation complex subunit (GINS family)